MKKKNYKITIEGKTQFGLQSMDEMLRLTLQALASHHNVYKSRKITLEEITDVA